MTEMTPNSPLDKLSQEVANLRREVANLNKRIEESDVFTQRILATLKVSEETFDLRVARSQLNMYAGLTHSLEHSIEDYVAELKSRQRGFEVLVVNGKDVLENADTIMVTKTKDGYDYSKVTDPTVICNEGTELFNKYFDENPNVFGDRDVILVNLLAPAVNQQSVEVPTDVEA